MRTRLARCASLVLALAAVSALAEAQRWPRRPPDPPETSNTCAAAGIDCLFGDYEGCSVNCGDRTPYCKGGGCIFGFPIAPECTCI